MKELLVELMNRLVYPAISVMCMTTTKTVMIPWCYCLIKPSFFLLILFNGKIWINETCSSKAVLLILPSHGLSINLFFWTTLLFFFLLFYLSTRFFCLLGPESSVNSQLVSEFLTSRGFLYVVNPGYCE